MTLHRYGVGRVVTIGADVIAAILAAVADLADAVLSSPSLRAELVRLLARLVAPSLARAIVARLDVAPGIERERLLVEVERAIAATVDGEVD